MIENKFATGATYYGGSANPSAPWGPAAPTDFMDPFCDLGLQYAQPILPMMSPFAANANVTGNDYQGRINAPSFNTPLEANVGLPKTPPSPARPISTAMRKSTKLVPKSSAAGLRAVRLTTIGRIRCLCISDAVMEGWVRC